MKMTIYKLCVPLVAIALLTACNHPPAAGNTAYENENKNENKNGNTTESASNQLLTLDISNGELQQAKEDSQPLPDAIFDSYYAGQSDPAFAYFQKSRIQRFLAMWVKEATEDIEEPVWNLDSFAQIVVLDHDFTISRPDEQLHYCTFSDGAERYGYAIVKYDALGPSLLNWSIMETTPYQYDLRACAEEIAASLSKTDIDLSTATASRVYLFDRDRNRADQVIRFTDGKGDNYICYFGDSTFEVKKWETK